MTVSLKHTFTSAKTDSLDATIVQPSNWNAEHELTLATNKVLGRATAGTGAAEELSVGTALSVSGGTLAVTTVPAANGGTGVATLPANNVLIGNGTSAVTGVAPGTSGNVLVSNGTSWTSSNNLATPLAVVGNATAGAQIRLPEDTDNGANYVALKAADSIASNLTLTLPSADGTNGQFLQTNGSGTLSFGTASGSLVLLQTVTGSAVDTIDITGNFTSTYKIYKLYITAVFSGAVQVGFQFYLNGSLITTSVYGYSGYYATSSTPSFQNSSSQPSALPGSLGQKLNTFELTLFNPSDTTNRCPIAVSGAAAFDSSVSYFNGILFNSTGGSAGTRAITGIRATTGGSTGTWTANLYGIKE